MSIGADESRRRKTAAYRSSDFANSRGLPNSPSILAKAAPGRAATAAIRVSGNRTGGLPAAEVALELTFVTGERLRISDAVDLTFLRRVLEALRA